jgi:hypothetical protein
LLAISVRGSKRPAKFGAVFGHTTADKAGIAATAGYRVREIIDFSSVTLNNGATMAYRSTDKTRQKKDAKRTALMQSAVRVFANKGYHAATVRDIVQEANVAVGTFYFYFPDKETLFVYLYEETADFLLQTLQQALGRAKRVSPASISRCASLCQHSPL